MQSTQSQVRRIIALLVLQTQKPQRLLHFLRAKIASDQVFDEYTGPARQCFQGDNTPDATTRGPARGYCSCNPFRALRRQLRTLSLADFEPRNSP